jgi:endonuclease I
MVPDKHRCGNRLAVTRLSLAFSHVCPLTLFPCCVVRSRFLLVVLPSPPPDLDSVVSNGSALGGTLTFDPVSLLLHLTVVPHWDASDSLAVSYSYMVGTSPWAANIAGWTCVNHSSNGSSLTPTGARASINVTSALVPSAVFYVTVEVADVFGIATYIHLSAQVPPDLAGARRRLIHEAGRRRQAHDRALMVGNGGTASDISGWVPGGTARRLPVGPGDRRSAGPAGVVDGDSEGWDPMALRLAVVPSNTGVGVGGGSGGSGGVHPFEASTSDHRDASEHHDGRHDGRDGWLWGPGYWPSVPSYNPSLPGALSMDRSLGASSHGGRRLAFMDPRLTSPAFGLPYAGWTALQRAYAIALVNHMPVSYLRVWDFFRCLAGAWVPNTCPLGVQGLTWGANAQFNYPNIWWGALNNNHPIVFDPYSPFDWASDSADQNPGYPEGAYRRRGKYPNQDGTAPKYDREHSFPKSWWNNWGVLSPAYSDLHHMWPALSAANSRRGNDPLGNVDHDVLPRKPNSYWQLGSGFTGVKRGRCTHQPPAQPFNLNLNQACFEPKAAFKGALARGILYMAVRYAGGFPTGYGGMFRGPANTNFLTWELNGGVRTLPRLTPWYLATLIAWADHYPVSPNEMNRNHVIWAIQGNTNPFVDCHFNVPVGSTNANAEQAWPCRYINQINGRHIWRLSPCDVWDCNGFDPNNPNGGYATNFAQVVNMPAPQWPDAWW